ncbi:lanC-like protein 3 homolog [Paramacrobiotus metropolitanus]|uniref:lanC-like protein 3 homolog n=1 Tax=Paramacrobiotus metropolitanus TaxID=2943436 RepID=UPI0024456D6B|nr:lanC-like protein 3 homolog [Paramacrobiotus metropolitanus]XP_055338179.1 lanC-like protein 3 homolog [Paramacrobiotus metropolitanus]XP_055338180.1 lanC-like protein 3 homolog [Paramacrobiotus metropolitanus]
MAEEIHYHYHHTHRRHHGGNDTSQEGKEAEIIKPGHSMKDTEGRQQHENYDKSDHDEEQHVPRKVPEVKLYHTRYFENPFPEYYGQPVGDSGIAYLEDAPGLLRKVYHYYSEVDLTAQHADIYTGLAGVAYSCMRIAQTRNIAETDREMAVGLGRRLLEAALVDTGEKDDGFLIGAPGVFVVGALFYHATGEVEKAEQCLLTFADFCKNVDSIKHHKSSGDELFSGRAGYLAGLLELWKVFPNHEILKSIDVKAIVEAIIHSGRKYSKKQRLEDVSPLYFYHFDSDYLGHAHGASFILQMLLSFLPVLKQISGAEEDIKKSIDYLIGQHDKSGNFPPVFGEKRLDPHDELVHWCHGAPGVIYMVAKAYMVYKDKKYLDVCELSADCIWKKGLLRKGPGICHGIAGNGYAFLIMYRLTGQAEYYYRAQSFADIMFHAKVQEKSRTPDHPYSLFEGVAGSACFLVDLVNPEHAQFPFCDIFASF